MSKLARVGEGSGLRQEIAGSRDARRGSLPVELRRRVQAYVQRRVAEGASQSGLARELGLSAVTVGSWCRQRRKPTFHAVTVVEAPGPSKAQGGSLVVVTPRGLRIEGLDVLGICQLVERLG